jgi:hypothetical protein
MSSTSGKSLSGSKNEKVCKSFMKVNDVYPLVISKAREYLSHARI